MPTCFITGSSKGFGKILAEEFLKRGHNVIASARDAKHLGELEKAGATCVTWDVESPLSQLQEQAQDIIRQYGPVDILINNAGYIQQGILEETSPETIQKQFNVNVFGLINTTKAFLPHMRERNSGTIVNLGSIAGYFSTPIAGIYCTSKFAVRGVSETFRAELGPLGIDVLLVEPGYFRTDFLSRTEDRNARPNRIAAYDPQVAQYGAMLDGVNGKQAGDPVKGAAVIADYVEGTGKFADKQRPGGICLGKDAYEAISGSLRGKQENLDEWKEVTDSPMHED